MLFKQIKLTNYRCFKDGVIDFTIPGNSSKKNIILCSWENGGGKTNLLFAFRFALYGMTELEYAGISGQEETPWALNQNVYLELERKGKIGDTETAKVELSFEYQNQTYTICRSHVFTRDANGVSHPNEKVALYIQNEHGDTAKVYNDSATVRRYIERIIPEKTLYAILCDGERVRRLSSTGAETNLAINAVIARMTEHELLNLVEQGLGKVRRQLHRKITSGASKEDDQMLAVKCENLKKEIDDATRANLAYTQRIDANKKELNKISQDLIQIDTVKQLERDRVREERVLQDHEKDLAKAQEKLIETLNKQSYWSVSGKLCDAVKKLMDNTTLMFPGLEADIVAMVMKGDTCICGRDINEHIRSYMETLRKKLPPFNVDAILSGVMHEYGAPARRKEYKEQIAERIESINEVQDKINSSMEVIAELKKRIEASNNPNAAALEAKRQELDEANLEMAQKWAVNKNNIEQNSQLLAEYAKRLKELTQKTENGKTLSTKLEFVEAAERGVEAIKNVRETVALELINKYLEDAFAKLRSSADQERQVYITQFEESRRLVVYHEDSVKEELKRMGINVNPAIREKVILGHLTGNSMGQLKMTSLAFMKAILSYVKDVATKDSNLADAEYPVLMDAPFGDIKRENYNNAVKYIHSFANQVIILLADEDIPDGIEQYVARRYTVSKSADKKGFFNSSKIVEVK